ncbi:MAG: hypothetical protein Q8Q15_00585 [bacterium]|nr:hypothetical protein [bacterium]
MKRKTVILIFLMVLVLGVVKIVMTAKLATTGADLALIQSEEYNLAAQNLVNMEKIAQASSMRRITSEAERLGFVKADKIVSLTPDIPIALRR